MSNCDCRLSYVVLQSYYRLLPNQIKDPNMFSATVSKVAPKIQPLAVQGARHMSAISGPPTVKVSTLEQLVHGVAITVGVLAIPAWVLVNIKNYRGQEE